MSMYDEGMGMGIDMNVGRPGVRQMQDDGYDAVEGYNDRGNGDNRNSVCMICCMQCCAVLCCGVQCCAVEYVC